MASLNGISIKGLKTFKDHEGMGICQGNLYIGGRKIGFWSQDAWGGPDIVRLDAQYSERKLDSAIKEKGFEYSEDFLWKLLEMKFDEDDWKKSGAERLFIGTDGYHVINIEVDDPDATVDDILKRKDVLRHIDANFFKNKDFNFRIVDAKYFDQGEPIRIEDITI